MAWDSWRIDFLLIWIRVHIIAFLGEHHPWHVKDYAQLEYLLRVAPAESRGISPGGIRKGFFTIRFYCSADPSSSCLYMMANLTDLNIRSHTRTLLGSSWFRHVDVTKSSSNHFNPFKIWCYLLLYNKLIR